MLPWTTARASTCVMERKNCYNNAWVYNVYVYVYVLCVYGYINLRIESQHPLVMIQIIFGNCLFFIHPT